MKKKSGRFYNLWIPKFPRKKLKTFEQKIYFLNMPSKFRGKSWLILIAAGVYFEIFALNLPFQGQ